MIAAAIALIAIPTIIVIVAHGYTSYFNQYSRFTQQISERTGLNLYLAKAAAALLALPMVYGLRSLYSLSSKRRQIGLVLIALTTVVYNSGLYWATRDANFGLKNGESIRWYAITPEGVKYYSRPGVDPKFGIPLKPVTPDVVRFLEKLDGSALEIEDPNKAEWFNPITDDPELWYFQTPSGTWKFFNKPGFDPVTGTTLQAVSREFREHWQAQRTAAQANAQERRDAAEQAAAEKEKMDRAETELKRQQEDALANAKRADEENKKRVADEKFQAASSLWHEAEGRLKGELAFWNRLRAELTSSGGTLRPEIESALQTAQSTASDCEGSYSQRDGDALQLCTKSLNRDLDKIEAFKN